MKLKNFIGMCITCFAVASMATIAHAEYYAIGDNTGHVDGSDHPNGTIDVPVMIIPEGDETASVNGYIMSFTYDPNVAAPHNNGDSNSPYATEGDAYKDGIMVSGTNKTADNKETLIVAWAASAPITLTSADVAKETIANITFDIKDETVANIPVHVEIAQLAQNAENVQTETDPGLQDKVVADDYIDLQDILKGDVDNNGKVEITDAALIAKHVAQIPIAYVLDNAKADIDGNNTIDISDAALIAKYVAKLIATL